MSAKSNLLETLQFALISGDTPTPTAALSYLKGYLELQGYSRGYWAYPLLESTAPDHLLAGTQNHLGMFQLSPFPLDRKSPSVITFVAGARLCIHWPTLLRLAADLAFTNPALALFVLSFKDILQSHSPFVAEVLERKYACDTRRLSIPAPDAPVAHNGTPTGQRFPVSPDIEISVLNHILGEMSNNSDIIYALQAACARGYCSRTHDNARRSLRSYLTTALGRGTSFAVGSFTDMYVDHIAESSMLHLAEPEKCSASVGTILPPPSVIERTFNCIGLSPIINEFWVAYSMAKRIEAVNSVATPISGATYRDEIVKALGVVIHSNVLLINWGKWLLYRDLVCQGSTILRYIKDPRLTEYRKNSEHAALFSSPGFAVSPLRTVHSKLHFSHPTLRADPMGIPSGLRARFEKDYWSGTSFEVDEDGCCDVTAIDIDALRTYSTRSSVCRVRHLRDPSKPLKPVATSSSKPRPKPKPLCCSIELTEDFSCLAVHTGRRVVFVPSWDVSSLLASSKAKVPDDALQQPTTPVYKTMSGVVYIPELDVTAITAGVLLNRSRYTPPEAVKVAIQRLSVFSTMSRTEFESRYLPNTPAAQRKLSSRFWTAEEDLIIKTTYRPDMSEEAMAKLRTVCANRKPQAISNRARLIRDELIAKGVYDLNDLPHRNYNAKLAREITKAKASASK